MTNFNLIDLMKNTKQMLVAYIREQDRTIAQHAKVIGDLKQEIEMLKAQGAATKGQSIPSRRDSAAQRPVRRPLASFFYLKDAGDYITELKARGCKVALTAQRDERGHFVVFAG